MKPGAYPDLHVFQDWDRLDKKAIVERQMLLLRNLLLGAVIPYSDYYSRRIHRNDVYSLRSLEDLNVLSFTRKRDLDDVRQFVLQPTQAQLGRRPATIFKALTRGPAAAKAKLAHEYRPVLMTSTTGRSAKAVPFVYSARDLDILSLAGARMMQVCETQQSWRHMNLFPYAPHLAFWQAHHAGLGFDAFMLSTGGGKAIGTDKNLQLIDKVQPDALIGMPTFIYHVLHQAVSEGRSWTNVKRLVLGGEKVPPGMRRKLLEMLRVLGSDECSVMATYGLTEAKMAWPECPGAEGRGGTGYHLSPDLALVEVIDPESGLVVDDGCPGEIVITPLQARGTVVIRYRTGDLIDGGLTYEPCPHCGRTCPRLVGSISRVSNHKRLHIDKIKGTLVDFNEMEVMLDDLRGLGAWQIELRKENDDPMAPDEVHVYAAPEGDMSEGDLTMLIGKRFTEITEFTPNGIHITSMKEMRSRLGVGEVLKEEKLVDLRKKNDG